LSYAEIAELLFIDDNTIRNYYTMYKEAGIEGLCQYHYTGGLSYLSNDEQRELDKHLQANTYQSSKEIAHHIAETYGVEYTPVGVRWLLGIMGFVFKKMKHLPGKGDVAAQKEFVQQYEELKAGKAKEDKIYFADGVHPLHNSIPASGWIKKGQEKAVQANTGRDRLNINGACNAADGEVIVVESGTINAQSTIALFDKMQDHQPEGKLHIITDNAKYYRSKMVREYLDMNPRINLIFLPPYSPNLNLIERLWKMYKKETLYNTYYETFAAFRESTNDFFEKISGRKKELSKLLNEKFYFPNLRFAG
jgi:transposase